MPRATNQTPANNRLVFTKRAVEKLRAPANGRDTYHDLRTPGLQLRVTANGVKTFSLFRRVNGQPTRIGIGTFPSVTVEQARESADRLNGSIANGVNPAEKRRAQRDAPTLGEVFEEYIETPTRGKAKRPRSPKTTKDYRWQFGKHLAAWKNRKLSQISRADLERLHNQIGAEHGHYIANRILALLKALFNFAVEHEYYHLNPAARLRGFEERSRDRFLTADELPAWWQAVEAEEHADFFKLCLLTGARQSNVLAARWEQFDGATWSIPSSKSGKPLKLPLSPAAVKILEERRERVSGEWVFPSSKRNGPMAVPKHGWDRILKAAGLTDVRLHDLRRSLGSWQASAGASLPVIGRSLGHSTLAATAIYSRVSDEAVRESVTAANDAILKAATKKPKKPKQPPKETC